MPNGRMEKIGYLSNESLPLLLAGCPWRAKPLELLRCSCKELKKPQVHKRERKQEPPLAEKGSRRLLELPTRLQGNSAVREYWVRYQQCMGKDACT